MKSTGLLLMKLISWQLSQQVLKAGGWTVF